MIKTFSLEAVPTLILVLTPTTSQEEFIGGEKTDLFFCKEGQRAKPSFYPWENVWNQG